MKTIAWMVVCLGAWLVSWGLAAESPNPSPIPKPEELKKAEGIVQEVFGRDIAKAKSPTEKIQLAKEIMRQGLEDKDLANQYAALQAAKRLAIEAQDGALGLEIVRELVARFEPAEKMPAWERLAEADRLWQEAQTLKGQARLAKQIQAAEEYLAVLLTVPLIEKRLAEIGNRDFKSLLKQAVLISFETRCPIFPTTLKLIPHGPVSIAPGIAGTSILLDGRGAVEVPIKEQSQNGFTVSAWFLIPTLPQNPEASIITTEDLLDGPDERGFVLRIWHNKPQFQIGCGLKRWRGTMTDISIQASKWHHIVGSYDAQAKQIVLYLDNKQIASAETELFVSSGRQPWIGKRSPSRLLQTEFRGQIDEIALFPQVLGKKEIAILYALGKKGIPLTEAVSNTSILSELTLGDLELQ